MSLERAQGGLTARPLSRRRTSLMVRLALVVASVLILFSGWASGSNVATARVRRAQEIETREERLYRRLADKDGVLESQRRIYVQRLRGLEDQIRRKDQEITDLRNRLATTTLR